MGISGKLSNNLDKLMIQKPLAWFEISNKSYFFNCHFWSKTSMKFSVSMQNDVIKVFLSPLKSCKYWQCTLIKPFNLIHRGPQTGSHTCITYDAVNQAYIDARKRIRVSAPKGDWQPEDVATVGELLLDMSIQLART
jgi:hypothetical protein